MCWIFWYDQPVQVIVLKFKILCIYSNDRPGNNKFGGDFVHFQHIYTIDSVIISSKKGLASSVSFVTNSFVLFTFFLFLLIFTELLKFLNLLFLSTDTFVFFTFFYSY